MTQSDDTPLKVLAWGTYDLSKPRVRLLLQGLRESGAELQECHADVWGETADKSQIRGLGAKLGFLLRWVLAYPRLLWRLWRSPRPDVILVGYLGQFDVLMLWPVARLMGVPVAWDAFLSLYNTVVEDRQLFGRRHPAARLLYGVEWLATRAVDLLILDTRAHADYFVERFSIDPGKTAAVFVGAEVDVFQGDQPARDPAAPYTVLFYGQFIPLHGIPTIIEAARRLQDEPVRWVLIGKGQEESRIRGMLQEQPLPQLEWQPWVPYDELGGWIRRSDVCLGIFDSGTKASRVIANKVFQILTAGRPLITRNSPAMRELVELPCEGVWLVPPDDPVALAEAVLQARGQSFDGRSLHQALRARFSTAAIGAQLRGLLLNLARP